MNWLLSANSKMYDHASSFEHFGFIDWRQGKTRFSIGDIIYIYCTKPTQKIRYKCQIEKLDMDFQDIRDDKGYWKDEAEYRKSLQGAFFRLKLIDQIDTPKLNLSTLQEHGLKVAPQSPMKLHGEILIFVEKQFSSTEGDDFFPETIDPATDIYEGIKKQVTVNKYERSSIARAKCVEANGFACKICGFDFKKVYGDIGTDFIHVHHLIPLHKIGQHYKINYESDLIPVCPNCHAMLHKKINEGELSVAQLKGRLIGERISAEGVL